MSTLARAATDRILAARAPEAGASAEHDPYPFKPGRLSSHGHILRFLSRLSPESCVLDVGTAAGYLGSSLKARGFRRLIGIEAHPQLAQAAERFYDTLVVGDLESATLPASPARFDVIVLADVLEHLRNPDRTLAQLCHRLAPAGWVVISLPNVAHWSVRLSLLAGRFIYSERGLLDRTHLRFFTRATARRLIGEAGLAIRREAVTPLPFSSWQRGSPIPALWRGLEWIDWGLARLRPTLCAYQLLFFAQRAA